MTTMPRPDRRHYPIISALFLILLMGSCSYDETFEVCPVLVQLVYPENSIGPYTGARVEMKSAANSIFVDSTNATGAVHFTLPPGIYDASSNSQYIDSTTNTWWHYIFNGNKSLIIISPDSTNRIELPLKMSRKRIVH